MNSEKHSKAKVIEYISVIRDAEASKPSGEADNDIIQACVELLLDLQDKEVTLSTEEINERVRKIPFADTEKIKAVNTKGKARKLKKKKILLIAAVIAILVTLLSIISIAYEWNIFDVLKNKYGSVLDAPIGVVHQENGISVKNLGEIKTYDNIEQAFADENLDVLLPRKHPDEPAVDMIKVYWVEGSEEISVSFYDKTLSYRITRNGNIPPEVFNDYDEIAEINDLQCYVVNLESVGRVQIYFMHNNNTYIFEADNKQILLEIIENLEESN